MIKIGTAKASCLKASKVLYFTFSVPSKGDTVGSHVNELIGGGEADWPSEVREGDGGLELEDDDGVALDGGLDHPDDAAFLFPWCTAVQSDCRESSYPL